MVVLLKMIVLVKIESFHSACTNVSTLTFRPCAGVYRLSGIVVNVASVSEVFLMSRMLSASFVPLKLESIVQIRVLVLAAL